MEHQLWPILQKPFICDKTRQDKTMFYLESYTVLCISTLSIPMYIDFIPAPPTHACKAYFSATPKDGDTIAWLSIWLSHIDGDIR